MPIDGIRVGTTFCGVIGTTKGLFLRSVGCAVELSPTPGNLYDERRMDGAESLVFDYQPVATEVVILKNILSENW